jgi:hypothetical protein
LFKRSPFETFINKLIPWAYIIATKLLLSRINSTWNLILKKNSWVLKDPSGLKGPNFSKPLGF